jgi:predicted MFS family arabinose efflux permease
LHAGIVSETDNQVMNSKTLATPDHAPAQRPTTALTAQKLPPAQVWRVFAVFAFAYFFSALVRAITATLAPTLTHEFDLSARDLGLLAGAYFAGFATLQLPLGGWLDRFGPKRVLLAFLSLAVLACVAFAFAQGFASLLLARALCGAGVSACLMAPMTAYRRWFKPEHQMRATSWMLMTGALGTVASTLPVQWLMPVVGWRGIFIVLAAALLLAMLLLAFIVPLWQTSAPPPHESQPSATSTAATQAPSAHWLTGYAAIFCHPYFRRLTPIGFFNYGGMIAIQTLWAGPWLQQVAGYSAAQSALGLFWLNICMLGAFWFWGWVNPLWARRGIQALDLMRWGMPLSLLALAANVWLGEDCGWQGWALFCASSTVVALSQPSVGLAFAPEQAGRALSAYNLVIFLGVFVVQWGIGLLIDAGQTLGLSLILSYQTALGLFGLCCALSYGYLLRPAGRA